MQSVKRMIKNPTVSYIILILYLPYSMLSSPPKLPTFSQIHVGRDKGDFLFSKILQFFTKRATRELNDYYGIVPKEEKIRGSSPK